MLKVNSIDIENYIYEFDAFLERFGLLGEG